MEIPWHLFQKAEHKTSDVTADIPEVTGIALAYKDENRRLASFTEKTAELSAFLQDEDTYIANLGNATAFEAKIGSLFGDSYREKISRSLFQLLEEVYSSPHTYVHSVTLVGLGRALHDTTEQWELTLHVNTMSDSTTFNTYEVVLYTSEDGIATAIQWSDVPVSLHATVRPLEGDAFIPPEFQTTFQKDLQAFQEQFDNQKLYARLGEKATRNHRDIVNRVRPLVKEGMAIETLGQLFVDTRGSLNNGVFSAYTLTDLNAEALTHYTYQVGTEKGIRTYLLTYSRADETLTGIQEILKKQN